MTRMLPEVVFDLVSFSFLCFLRSFSFSLLWFSLSSSQNFLSPRFRVIREPVLLMCMWEIACAFVEDQMRASKVVYKLHCSRRSDKFSRVGSISYICFISVVFYYPVMCFSK